MPLLVIEFAQAVDKTYMCLRDTGARVAPDKSYNFASNKDARRWLAETKWPTIGTTIRVV